jgi:glutamate 5-kinase
MRVVAKIGTSSLTDDVGVIDRAMIANICRQIAQLRVDGHEVVLVTSGAVSAGVSALGMKERPSDIRTLQALAAAGQKKKADLPLPAGKLPESQMQRHFKNIRKK